jgi:hypothetical protein
MITVKSIIDSRLETYPLLKRKVEESNYDEQRDEYDVIFKELDDITTCHQFRELLSKSLICFLCPSSEGDGTFLVRFC